ncbi:MAG: hypothetical protein CVV25_09600 [Ignavibacteriae bacterium HGW-Ignavibacteriae-4]|jgi:hypothetical protein|nr:MAG: hypothetical protein CVV25_09600 [Ignavibacteriae bacterium HGW-Ignavibacteriae-4]
MKTIVCVVLFVILSTQVWAHPNSNVPDIVKSSFAKKYQDATDIEWEQDDDEEGDNWEVEYEIKSKEYSSLFDKNGKWIQTETEINISDLPSNAKATITKKFKNFKIIEVESLEDTSGNFYVIKIKNGKTEMEVTTNLKGEFIRQELEKEDNEDKD